MYKVVSECFLITRLVLCKVQPLSVHLNYIFVPLTKFWHLFLASRYFPFVFYYIPTFLIYFPLHPFILVILESYFHLSIFVFNLNLSYFFLYSFVPYNSETLTFSNRIIFLWEFDLSVVLFPSFVSFSFKLLHLTLLIYLCLHFTYKLKILS